MVLALATEPGFRLNVALYRARTTRERLADELERALAKEKIRLTRLDFAGTPQPRLLLDLQRHMEENPAPEGWGRAVSVTSLEEHLGLAIAQMNGADRQLRFLENANLHRDAFPRAVPCPVVLWLTASALGLLQRHAPDLWDWRAHTFRFAEADGPAFAGESALASLADFAGSDNRYTNRRQMLEAIEVFERALAGYEQREERTSIDAWRVRDRLGNALYQLGDYDRAEPMLRENLAIAERMVGPEHPYTLTSLNNLAAVLHEKGDLAIVEPLYRRVLETSERILGAEHPETLKGLNNLAGLLLQEGDFTASELLFRRALEGRERILSPEHPDTLMSLNNLAALLHQKGDLDAAEPLVRRALEVRGRVFGPEHPDTLASLNNLAGLLGKKGDLDAAEPLFRRALAGYERLLGPEHPDTLMSLNNLALLLLQKGDLDAAEPLYRRALEAQERLLGPEHPDTCRTAFNLSLLCAHKSDLDEARRLAQRAVDGVQRSLPANHPSRKNYEAHLARLLAGQ